MTGFHPATRSAEASSGLPKAIVLSGSDLTAVNSIAEPAKVAPKEETLTNTATTFTRTFPAYSVTLLRFPAAK